MGEKILLLLGIKPAHLASAASESHNNLLSIWTAVWLSA